MRISKSLPMVLSLCAAGAAQIPQATFVSRLGALMGRISIQEETLDYPDNAYKIVKLVTPAGQYAFTFMGAKVNGLFNGHFKLYT